MTQTDNIKMVVTHDRQERKPITVPKKMWAEVYVFCLQVVA